MALHHRKPNLLLLLALFVLNAVLVLGAASDPNTEAPVYFKHQRRALANPPAVNPPKYQNVSVAELQNAQKLVAAAVAQQEEYNRHRVANPRRNTYKTRGAALNGPEQSAEDASGPPAPELTDELVAASVLVAEHTARQQLANGTLHKSYNQFANLPRPVLISRNDTAADKNEKRSDGSIHERADEAYWVSSMSGNGLAPMGYDASYPVFRDVTNPMFGGGAKGDGVTDDTAAINAAIAYGGNCGANCLSSSVKGTLIYFPPGTYLISTPINAYYYSQLVGDANDFPIIQTTASFVGLGAIQSDVYYPGGSGGEWYIEQSNFFRQVRNLVIDIRDTTTNLAAGLHWQVGQATSVTNVSIACIEGSNNTQMGIFTENGSGGFMSDVVITGGAYGIYGGNQQYTVRDFQIINQLEACICLIWDWGWTWSGLFLGTAPVGISLLNPQGSAGGGAITGSTYIMDSTFFDVDVAIDAAFNKTILESSIITLDNVDFSGVITPVTYANGDVLEGIPVGGIDFAVIGNVESEGLSFGQYMVPVATRPAGLTTTPQSSQMMYYARSRPQYETLSAGDIISVKDHGAMGDGTTDDTAAITAALALATTSNLIYFPAGSYIVTSTIVVPPNTRMTGEVWSQLVASGDYFSNMTAPQVMIQVGNVGDVGTVEISDMLFTSRGSLPGLVMVEWNVQAASQGSVGMWDSHFRVGGAYGTELQLAQCPASTPSIQAGCVAANMMLHVTAEANGYFENVWAWVADHDIDDPQNSQITVGVARGMLFESTGPNWLYGTASEHSILYQYNFVNASNTFAGMIQTESAYFQAAADTESPGPFNSSVGQYAGDPVFPDSTCNGTSLLCNIGWSLMMQSTTNVSIAGAGFYSWYDNYNEACVDTQNCQQRIVWDDGNNGGFYLWNLVTIGSVEMISGPGTLILAAPNTQADGHPFWSALAGYLDSSNPIVLSCTDDDTSAACVTTSLCDLTQSYATIADLNAASGSFPNQCMNYYAIDTLGTVLNDTLNNYTDVNSGYDAVFGDYQSYMLELIPQMIQDFMAPSTSSALQGGPGNQFFDCTSEGYGATSTQQCPFTWRQLEGAESFTMTYTLINSTGFYDTIQSMYGISPSWVTFGDRTYATHTGECTGPERNSCVITDYKYVNEPQAASNINVPNPKDTIANSLPAIYALQDTILARQLDLAYGVWNGSSADLIQVFSMPVFMVQQAVSAMAAAKQLGQQYAKEQKIQLILEILGAVFAFIPFLDDLLPEIEALSGVLDGVSAVSVAGNVGLTIQSIVSDPSSAPMEILGLLVGGAGRDTEDMAVMAAERRALTEDEIGKIGDDFKQNNDEFEGTVQPKCET